MVARTPASFPIASRGLASCRTSAPSCFSVRWRREQSFAMEINGAPGFVSAAYRAGAAVPDAVRHDRRQHAQPARRPAAGGPHRRRRSDHGLGPARPASPTLKLCARRSVKVGRSGPGGRTPVPACPLHRNSVRGPRTARSGWSGSRSARSCERTVLPPTLTGFPPFRLSVITRPIREPLRLDPEAEEAAKRRRPVGVGDRARGP